MNRTIWMYWEDRKGTHRPAYLDLCLETVAKHSPSYEIVVLDEESVLEYLPDLREDIFRTKEIAHRADYIRAKVVHRYGGMWLDSDIILLKEIDIEDALRRYDFVGCGDAYRRPSIWFFAANEGNPVIGEWVNRMDALLDRRRRGLLSRFRGYRFSWAELGYDILWPLMADYDYYHFEFARFAPVRWDEWEKFLRTDIGIGRIVSDDTMAVMLYNKFMFEPLRGMDRGELMSSDTLLSNLFRLSLEG